MMLALGHQLILILQRWIEQHSSCRNPAILAHSVQLKYILIYSHKLTIMFTSEVFRRGSIGTGYYDDHAGGEIFADQRDYHV
jgi:hypothetical protein